MSKLVKEIITTTTERFHEDGTVRERVVESREKVYDNEYSEKEIEEATEIQEEPKKEKVEPVQENKTIEEAPKQTQENLVKNAAASIDKKKGGEKQAPPNGYAPVGAINPPQYNVVGRQVPTPQTPTFPWEQPKY